VTGSRRLGYLTAAAAACGCAAPEAAPWWPAPAAAAPSPLLAAVGLAAPPPLAGPGCGRGPRPPWRFAGWRGTAAYVLRGPAVTCAVVLAAGTDSTPPPLAVVTADLRGRVRRADWTGPAQAGAAAARAADSTLRRGLAAPGAARCERQPPGPGPHPEWPWPEIRGWRTPAYEALVWLDPVGGRAGGHALRVAVAGPGSFPLCRRAGPRPSAG
jgi:hypothetical protein